MSATGLGPALPGDLIEHAARAPQVHLVCVEAIGEETLRGPVPAGGDVLCVRLLGIDTPAGPKVPQFQDILLQATKSRSDISLCSYCHTNHFKHFCTNRKILALTPAWKIQITTL